jgi:hypothetical protein
MLKKDDKIFFRLPKEDSGKKRALRPGVILEVNDNLCVVQLEAPCAVDESTDGFLHFEERRQFFQQSARVIRKDSEEPFVFALHLRGTAVSAESRQCFRVSCLSANIKATIADEAGCEVVDVSATGFAFYAQREYEIGRQVRATLYYDGREYTGMVTVQSSRRLNSKQVRYGVHGIASAMDNLTKSLGAINLAVQSEQLRRLSGRA